MAVDYKLGNGWESVELALHGWLSTQAGVDAVEVRWEYPGATQPLEEDGAHRDFGLLAIRGFYPRGLLPDVQLRLDDGRPPGDNLERIQRSPGVLVVAVDLVTQHTDGPDCAFHRLIRAAASLHSPRVFRPFRQAGLGLQAKGDVRNLSGLLGVVKQGRASFELRLNVGETMREFTGAAEGIRPVRIT